MIGRNYGSENNGTGAFVTSDAKDSLHYSDWDGQKDNGQLLDFKGSRTWQGTSTSTSPKTSPLGSGNALDITPAYYTCHMWLRIS